LSRVRRTFVALAWSLLAVPAAAAPPVMSFDEVQPGMIGTGHTVFVGTRIDTFDVEILGKLPNIGPDQNLILARLSGGPLAETRVMSGMSGSPVFIDGRLIGAVAYSWGFATIPIAGISPIEEMLAVAALGGAGARRVGATGPALDALTHREALATAIDAMEEALSWPVAAPVSTPLSVSGIGPLGLARIGRGLERLGFAPVQAGTAGADASATPPRLEPGSAVGVKLVRGDVEMAATGTVTWVEGDSVLAFGHPLFGLGSVDLPLTGARVEALPVGAHGHTAR